MKKNLIITAILTASSVVSFAQTISENQAHGIAASFMRESLGLPVPSARMRVQDSYSGNLSPYYIVNFDEAGAFVIVAGDERMKPILGYCTSQSYDESSMPEGMKDLLADYTSVYNGLQNMEFIEPAQSTTASAPVIVEPLVTSTWGQSGAYNYMCPTYGGSMSVTGCTATAMAQIMNYYQYPNAGQGLCSYSTMSFGLFVYLNLDGKQIDWPNIKDDYSGSYTKEEREAVANLMYYCGASIKMDYGLSESGAYPEDARTALVNNFNYQETANWVLRSNYTASEWTTMMNNELQAHRPMLYASYTEDYSFGHAYVVDGVNADGLYHINWGWDGMYDGYFALDMLQPYDGVNISTDHQMVCGIQPKGNKLSFVADDALIYVTYLEAGSAIPTVEAPEKEGYTFEGWENMPSVMPNATVVLNALYEPKSYTVTFMVDGEEHLRESVKYKDEIPYPERPAREGCSFSWSQMPELMPAHDLIINGSFTFNNYLLSYYVDDEPYHTAYIEYSSKITPLSFPVLDGYTFSGWEGLPQTMPAHEVSVYGYFLKDDEMEHPDYAQLSDVIYVEDATVDLDTDNTMDILLYNSKYVSGFQFDLVLPEEMTLLSVNKGFCISDLVIQGVMQFSVKEQADGSFRVLCYSETKVSLADNLGQIACAEYHVDPACVGNKTLVVKIKNQTITFSDGTSSSPRTTYAKIKVNSSTVTSSADLNNDDKTDAVDLGILINYVLSSDSAGDINEDGKTDAVDIGVMKDIILGK